MAQGEQNNHRHPDAHRDARDATQQSDLEPRVDKLEGDVHQLQVDFKSLGNRVYKLETGTTVPPTQIPPPKPADGNLEARVRELEENVHQLQINYKDLGNRVYKLETGISVQSPQVTPAPPPTGTLEQRVAKLEQDTAQLRLNADNLDDRVTALEADAEQPPDGGGGEQPPTDTLPPGQEGTENISEGKNLQQLVQNGGTVNLPPGSYLGQCITQQPTVVVGSETTLSARGLTISNGKAMFNAYAPLELRDLELRDVSVRDQNGATVRTEPGRPLIMKNCTVSNCQNGVLTNGNTTIEDCDFHDNGAGDGQTHEMYISCYNTPNAEFVLKNTNATCGTRSCHAVKSRAAKTTIQGCHLKGNTSGTAYAGTVLDIPDGGDALVEDTTIESAPGTQITGIIGYCMESAKQGAKTLTLRNVVVTDGKGNGGSIDTRQAAARLVLENCTYTGNTPPRLNGWGSVSGEFTKG